MKELFISDKQVRGLLFQLISKAVTQLNADVQDGMLELAARETNEIAKMNMDLGIKNCVDFNQAGDKFLCPDTGAPTFYIRMGDNVRIENGFSSLYKTAEAAIADATAQSRLRPNMVHPLTRENTGTNTGYGSPFVHMVFDPDIDYFEAVAVPISGGSETSGTYYRMLSPLDGKKGIIRFVLDCFKFSTYAGKTCPPNVIGIGIGGTSDVCMKIAKQAAVLRPVGVLHPEKEIADLEVELKEVLLSSGVGAMGMGGVAGVLDVHIEYAAAHISGLAVAYNAQCWITRRKVGRICPDGSIRFRDYPDPASW